MKHSDPHHSDCPSCTGQTKGKKKSKAKTEKEIDDSLKNTFPASDPPAPHQITGTEST